MNVSPRAQGAHDARPGAAPRPHRVRRLLARDPAGAAGPVPEVPRRPGDLGLIFSFCSPYAEVVPNVRACRVSFVDTKGITHTAQVTAASLFETAALGLATFRRCGLMDAAPGPATQITVSVAAPSTLHKIPMRKLTSWLATGGKSPNEQAVKVRLREMLPLP